MYRLKRRPQIEDDFKNEDDLKNEDNITNEDNLKNEDDLKNGDSFVLKTVHGPSLHNLSCSCFLVLNCGNSAAANRSAQAKMPGVHPGQTIQGSAGTLHPPPLHQAQPHPPHLQAATQTTPAPPQHHPAKAVVCQGDLECV